MGCQVIQKSSGRGVGVGGWVGGGGGSGHSLIYGWED